MQLKRNNKRKIKQSLPKYDIGKDGMMQDPNAHLAPQYRFLPYGQYIGMPDITARPLPQSTMNYYNQQLPRAQSGGMTLSKGGNIATSAVAFTGDVMNSFSEVSEQNELLQRAGIRNQAGAGFNYTAQNDINESDEVKQLEKQNRGNTLKTMGTGAALGSAVGSIWPGVGTVIGGAVGAVAGLVTGMFGSSHRQRHLRRRLYDARERIHQINNFNRTSAHTDYLTQNYNQSHEDTQDDIMYAKKGKDSGSYTSGIPYSVESYTSVGKVVTQPNARVAAGESIIDNIDDVSKTTGHIVKEGKLNKDTNYANLDKGTIVLGSDEDWRNGATFRDQALPYTKALEDINKKFETRTNSKLNKLRGIIGKESDDTQQYEVNKLKEPIVQKLKDLSEQQAKQHEMMKRQQTYNYRFGKDMLPGYKFGANGWGNAVTSGIGMLESLNQMLDAKNQSIRTPDIYAENPYTNTALATLAGLKSNPYPILRQIYDNDARSRYFINRSGGLSGAQKYLANVATGLQSNADITDALYKAQQQDSQYRTQYANALLSEGNTKAQRRQQANAYNEDYAASSHAARQQGIQMGMRNMLDQLQQYNANEFKRDQYNSTLKLYTDDVYNDEFNLRNLFGAFKKKNKNTTTPYVGSLRNNIYTAPILQNNWAFPRGYREYLAGLKR